jgi:hypothetical protein
VLAKYTMLLFPACVGLYLLADRSRRVELWRPGFWVLCGLTALGCVRPYRTSSPARSRSWPATGSSRGWPPRSRSGRGGGPTRARRSCGGSRCPCGWCSCWPGRGRGVRRTGRRPPTSAASVWPSPGSPGR